MKESKKLMNPRKTSKVVHKKESVKTSLFDHKVVYIYTVFVLL